MTTLLILATIGAIAGGLGGALTNGLDGLVLGACAGFVLGVIAWIADNIAAQRTPQVHPDQLFNEFQRSVQRNIPPSHEQPVAYQKPSEHTQSP